MKCKKLPSSVRTVLAASVFLMCTVAIGQSATDKPNILILWGDDCIASCPNRNQSSITSYESSSIVTTALKVSLPERKAFPDWRELGIT
jgi:hypothetical protein